MISKLISIIFEKQRFYMYMTEIKVRLLSKFIVEFLIWYLPDTWMKPINYKPQLTHVYCKTELL